jgi:hypothetical protein
VKNISVGLCLLLFLVGGAFAAPNSSYDGVAALAANVSSARYVYVTSYDGSEFSSNPLPQDQKAIANVQNAIQKWGKFVVVDNPQQADIVLMVQSRAGEDVLALYDAHTWPQRGDYLWRAMGPNGLQAGETPLVTNLRTAFEKIGQ